MAKTGFGMALNLEWLGTISFTQTAIRHYFRCCFPVFPESIPMDIDRACSNSGG